MVKVYEVGEVYFDGKTPVPNYDEYKRLQEQLNEANEVIKNTPTLDNFYTCFEVEENAKEARKYLEKWGVK